jgi:hypothetical protein
MMQQMTAPLTVVEVVQETRLQLLELEELIARSMTLLERSHELLDRTADMVSKPEGPDRLRNRRA